MKRIVMDLDGTLTLDESDLPYPDKRPNSAVVQQLRHYREQGFWIVISTARNMRTYDGNVGKINVHTLPIILEWLYRHEVPYDEVYVGKPWCGDQGFQVDDKSIRPDEFVNLRYDEIVCLLGLKQNAS